MPKYIQIKNGVVANIALFDGRKDKPKGWIESKYVDDIGVGWAYDEKTRKFEQPEHEIYKPSAEEERKRAMFEAMTFDGVVCSATKEDFYGLSTVKVMLDAYGGQFDFRFKNGNILKLTPDNIDEFMKLWLPIRIELTKIEEPDDDKDEEL